MVGQLHHLEQVVDHPGHQLPRAVFIVEPEGQLLQMAEQVAAHVRFHVRPQHVPPVVHKILKPRPDQIGGHQRADDGENHQQRQGNHEQQCGDKFRQAPSYMEGQTDRLDEQPGKNKKNKQRKHPL